MTQISDTRPRILWADLLRATAGLGVVFIHVSMAVVNHWGKKPLARGDEFWWISSVYYTFLVRASLGLFFMLSGYLLLSTRKETFSFLRKHLVKLLIPLAFWGTFYILWHGNYPQDTLKAIKFILLSLATGSVEFHLWFLYAFVGLYLFVPILWVFLQSANERDLWYYVAVWFLLAPIFGLFSILSGHTLSLTNYYYFGSFIGLFLLGYILGKRDLPSKWTLAAWIIIPLWAGAETFGLYLQTHADKFMDDRWFDFLSIFIVIYTALVFIALKGLGQRLQTRLASDSKVHAILKALSRASYGVILIHVVVLEYMYAGIGNIHLAPYDFNPLISIPIVSIVGYAICFGIVTLLHKIPLVREIVPA